MCETLSEESSHKVKRKMTKKSIKSNDLTSSDSDQSESEHRLPEKSQYKRKAEQTKSVKVKKKKMKNTVEESSDNSSGDNISPGESESREKESRDNGKEPDHSKKETVADNKIDTSEPDLKRLHVRNVDVKTTREELKELFPTAKHVILPKLRFTKVKYRFAFLEFEQESEAKQVLESMQDSILCGRELKLAYASMKNSSNRDKSKPIDQTTHTCSENSKQNALHLSNLNKETTEEHLRSTFNKWPITAVRIPETEKGLKRGFAFIEFEESCNVEAIIDEKQGCKLKGNNLHLEMMGRNKNKVAPKDSARIFLGGLPESIREADLRTHFPSAVSIELPSSCYKNGTKKHIAFVEFKSHKEAKAMVSSKQNMEIDGKKLRLELANS